MGERPESPHALWEAGKPGSLCAFPPQKPKSVLPLLGQKSRVNPPDPESQKGITRPPTLCPDKRQGSEKWEGETNNLDALQKECPEGLQQDREVKTDCCNTHPS